MMSNVPELSHPSFLASPECVTNRAHANSICSIPPSARFSGKLFTLFSFLLGVPAGNFSLLIHFLPVISLHAEEISEFRKWQNPFSHIGSSFCRTIELSYFIYSFHVYSFAFSVNENGTTTVTQFPNITKPFCRNLNLSDTSLLIYRFTLVFVQYIIPVGVISFVYIQVSLIDCNCLCIHEICNLCRWQWSCGAAKLLETLKTFAISRSSRTRRKSSRCSS